MTLVLVHTVPQNHDYLSGQEVELSFHLQVVVISLEQSLDFTERLAGDELLALILLECLLELEQLVDHLDHVV